MPELVSQYAATSGGDPLDHVKFTYDGWGNTVSSRQDHNSAVDASGSVDDYDVAWAFAKATGGRNTLRRDSVTYPNADLVEYTYLSTPHDADASRVTRVKYETVVVAEYSYLGLAQLAGQDLSQADARWHTYDTTESGTLYGDLDRFNRVVKSRWRGYRVSGTRDFYSVQLTYDRNSNITSAEDHVHTVGAAGTGNGLFDSRYYIDSVNRLTRSEEGNWTGSAIDNRKRDEQWTLTQTGNWANHKRDVNGDLNWADAGEFQDDGTFNLANELSKRELNTDGNAGYETTYNRAHDKAGNLTDDGDDYKYEYDAFGRLRKVKNRTSPYALVAEYTYNGLGQRIGWHYDVDDGAGNGPDGTVDGDDPWFRFVYDDAWRVVAAYRADDADPKEIFVYHAAGLGAFGGSSYIDSCVLRDRDNTSGWAAESDGVLEERRYYCQNWRGDVSAVLTSNGKMVEWVKYSSYGVPFAIPVGDTNSDGAATSAEVAGMSSGTYDVRKDGDLNGTLEAADSTHALSITGGYQTLGRGVLTSSAIGNRKGYAGYERDPTFHGAGRHLHHVRYRVYDADVGRWTRRDPQGYVDGMNLYAYVQGMAVIAADPMGLMGCHSRECVIRDANMARARSGAGADTRHSSGSGAAASQDYSYSLHGGPPTCAGGTCSIPVPPGPGGGGIGPITCMAAMCQLPSAPSSFPAGYCTLQQPEPIVPGTPTGPPGPLYPTTTPPVAPTAPVPFPPATVPCGTGARRAACATWASFECSQRQGSITPTCFAACVAAAAKCCNQNCGAPGRSKVCVSEGVLAMQGCYTTMAGVTFGDCFGSCFDQNFLQNGACMRLCAGCGVLAATAYWQIRQLCLAYPASCPFLAKWGVIGVGAACSPCAACLAGVAAGCAFGCQ